MKTTEALVISVISRFFQNMTDVQVIRRGNISTSRTQINETHYNYTSPRTNTLLGHFIYAQDTSRHLYRTYQYYCYWIEYPFLRAEFMLSGMVDIGRFNGRSSPSSLLIVTITTIIKGQALNLVVVNDRPMPIKRLCKIHSWYSNSHVPKPDYC